MSEPSVASETVTLFISAAEAAPAMADAGRAIVGVAGKARAVWNDPTRATVHAFVQEAEASRSKVSEGSEAAMKVWRQSRAVLDLWNQIPSGAAIPALPTGLGSWVGSASSVVGAASGLIPGLGLGVGLLSLGVGVFNTWQIRKTNKKLDALSVDVQYAHVKLDGLRVDVHHANVKLDVLRLDLHEGFARIESSLAWQSRQIALLAAGQSQLGARIEQLRREIQAGFHSVIDVVLSAEERQMSFDYQQQVVLVLNRYRSLQECLADDLTPSSRDLDRLLDACQHLAAWVQPRMSALPKGAPARLPYLVALALAARVGADVKALESEGADRGIKRVLEMISEEVFALCDGRSLYWIGVEVPELITQYAYLYRGLALGDGAGLSELAAGDKVQHLWDDGLAPLRKAFSGPTSQEPAWLRFGTLGDLSWYIDWKGLDPEVADIGAVRAVNLLEVANTLGATDRPDSNHRASVESLLAMALPAFREQAVARLMSSFAWTVAPKIVRSPLKNSPVPQLRASQTSQASTEQFTVAGVSHRLRWIAPGSFKMGSPETEADRSSDEGPQHTVRLSRGYWLGETPVTQALWEAVMGTNPSRFKGPERPVESVSWNDCQAFVKKLNGMVSGAAFRLPTEAEWEYACRAGTTGATWLGGNDASVLSQIAWYEGNRGKESHPVGKKAANPWGLHDMLGNVWEWCDDGQRTYASQNVTDPQGPSESGVDRVHRGGSCSVTGKRARAAFRSAGTPLFLDRFPGLRLARGQ